MKCPFCFTLDSIVKDSRSVNDASCIRRRRYCLKCRSKFTTFERVELRKLVIIKKSGAKKAFDRDKIYKSITTALRKRNISDNKANEITDNIVQELKNNSAIEIPSRKIGELIMQKLTEIDQVAYIRFASVYKDFNNVQDFAKFIGKIKSD